MFIELFIKFYFYEWQLSFTVYFRETLGEQLKKVRIAKVGDKKRQKALTAEQKKTLAEMQAAKQVSRFLLPDAPQRKQKRYEGFI